MHHQPPYVSLYHGTRKPAIQDILRLRMDDDDDKKTNTTPWSNIIKRRRLTWLGHLLRLHPDTPARRALEEYLRLTKKPQGRPKLTWISLIKQDLRTARIELNLKEPQETLDTLCGLARDRNAWRDLVRRAMLHQ